MTGWLVAVLLGIVIVVFIAVMAVVMSPSADNSITVTSHPSGNAIRTFIPRGKLLQGDGSIYHQSPGFAVMGEGILFDTFTNVSEPDPKLSQFTYQYITESILFKQDNNLSGRTGESYTFLITRQTGQSVPNQDDYFVVVDAGYVYNLLNSDGTVAYPNYYMNSTSSWEGSTGSSTGISQTATIYAYSGTQSNPTLLNSVSGITIQVVPYGSYTPTIRAAGRPDEAFAPPIVAYPTFVLVNGLGALRDKGVTLSSIAFFTVQITGSVIAKTTTVYGAPVPPAPEIANTSADPAYLSSFEHTPSSFDATISAGVTSEGNTNITAETTTQADGTTIATANFNISGDFIRTQVEYGTIPSDPDEVFSFSFVVNLNDILADAVPTISVTLDDDTIVTVDPPYTTQVTVQATDPSETVIDIPTTYVPTIVFSLTRELRGLSISRLRSIFGQSRNGSNVDVRVDVNLTMGLVQYIDDQLPSGFKNKFYIMPGNLASRSVRSTRDPLSDFSLTVAVANNIQICSG